jgi:hypothetical protein
MTRLVIAREDSPYGDGRVIAGGALHVDEGLIPVCMTSNPDAIVGSAKDFERDTETGELSMEITLFQYVNNDLAHYNAHVLVVPYETQDTADQQHVVTKGQIREVLLMRKNNGVEKEVWQDGPRN